MAAKKELQVSAVENGTVIDHIPANKLFDVIKLFVIRTLLAIPILLVITYLLSFVGIVSF